VGCPLTTAAIGLGAYLLGSIPFGLLIARARHIDIRTVGSGNIGATNVLRCVGKGWGALTFACDVFKGFVPAFFFPALACTGPEDPNRISLGLLFGALAIVGHNWPVFLRFKGGKGVATTVGALLGVAPGLVGIGFLAWLLVLLATGYVSLASILAAVTIPIAAWWQHADGPIVLPGALTLLGLLVIWRHKTNIKRLFQGTENRFRRGKRS
jgi:glycerol-3-phosphate acyltransferase PlsY